MKTKIYEGKNIDEVIKKATEELITSEENLVINIIEEKNNLLRKNIKAEVISYNDIISYIKEIINEITKLMNIEANLEIRRRENSIFIKIFSNNNAILIGKNGRTIQSLQTIIRQIISNVTKKKIQISLDIENYKEKKVEKIEYLTKKIAREVAKTKIEVKLDSMNSYERRIVHSLLSDDKYVYTESVGEEPNRCVVIKPREA